MINVSLVSGAPKERPRPIGLRVAETGMVTVPLVGDVHVAGMNLRQCEQAIRNASMERGVYHQPSVAVSVDSRHSNRVTVLGAVKREGTYKLAAAHSDLMTALVRAGGLTDEVGPVVEIRRPVSAAIGETRGPTNQVLPATYRDDGKYGEIMNGIESSSATAIQRVDLAAATSGEDDGDYYLEDGAVVVVSEKPDRFVHVIGLVKRPNRYQMPKSEETTLLGAISLAGGTTLPLADRVQVIRQIDGAGPPIRIKASLRAAKRDSTSNIRLAPGDVVSVEETPTTLAFGAVKQFGAVWILKPSATLLTITYVNERPKRLRTR